MSCPECVGVDTARRPMHLRVSPVQASVWERPTPVNAAFRARVSRHERARLIR
jgi:hypothetical protein